MKLTYVCFEGTPEELDASTLIRGILQPGSGTVDAARRAALVVDHPDSAEDVDFGWRIEGDVPGVAEEGQDTVKAQLAFNPAAQQFVDFLAKAGSWENVVVHGIKRKTWQAGEPLDYSGYLRLRRKGSQYGGFAYAFASTGLVNFRLRRSDQIEKLAPQAYFLTAGNPEYRVSILVRDEDTLEQALALAELAYDAT
ncbi:hypothetical protein [Streptomyces sp. MK7]|uniref:hypothetical protein n=1 Tax=Streptomyces sp. MK7 TaxID=3067635 RepID=UPI00292E5B51|nr:hypothetical protein [Streptomyces sp. MK7]